GGKANRRASEVSWHDRAGSDRENHDGARRSETHAGTGRGRGPGGLSRDGCGGMYHRFGSAHRLRLDGEVGKKKLSAISYQLSARACAKSDFSARAWNGGALQDKETNAPRVILSEAKDAGSSPWSVNRVTTGVLRPKSGLRMTA